MHVYLVLRAFSFQSYTVHSPVYEMVQPRFRVDLPTVVNTSFENLLHTNLA